MKRPMCILAVSWLAGLVLAGCQTGIGTTFILIIYFILIIFGLVILKKNPQILVNQVQQEWYPELTVLLLLIPCLFLAGNRRMEQELARQKQMELPWKLLEEEGEAYVTVEGVVKEKICGEQVVLELEECVIIGYYGQENQPAGNCRIRIDGEGKEWLPEAFVGNKIRVFGTFSTFQPAGNPGQFDAWEYYTKKGLYADVSALRVTILDGAESRLGHAMFQLKQQMRKSICSLYPEEKAGVLTAMILGDKDLLSEEVEDLYRKNGISHILAISGLHISMLCMGLFGLLRKLTVPPRTAAAVALCFLIFYLIFTGGSVSSLRAGVMCVVVIGAKLLRRSYDMLSSLAFAAIAVTCLQPSELTSAGFLLSFGAVVGMALAKEVEDATGKTEEGKRLWWSGILYGGLLQCVTMPISLWFFYELSPYSIFLNLVVIPLVSLILGGGILSAVLGMVLPSVARLPVGGTYLLLEFYEWICGLTQKLPFSFVLVGRPAVWQLVVYYILFLTVVKLFLTRAERTSGFRWCLGLLGTVLVLFLPWKQNTELLFLDVSQGDGALIATEEGTVILSDCGSSDVSKVGEYRLSPMLKQKGILLVDMAVVSHLDSDHMSGIKELLEKMPVYHGLTRYAAEYEGAVGIKELVLPKVLNKSEAYLELEKLALEKNVDIRYMEAGNVLYQEENLLIECLYPQDAKESENDTSLVFLLQTPQLLAWLMGDAGIAPETELMEQLKAVNMEELRNGRLVVLKVGHHGSKTSSGQAFVDFVQPEVSVISCGWQNSYGHPHDSVTKRLDAAGVRVFRTDLQGAIVVETGFRQEVVIRGWLENQRK